MDLIQVSGDRLHQLIQNLSDLSRIQNGEMKMQKVSMNPDSLIQEVVQALNPVAQSRAIWLRGDGSAAKNRTIECDHDRILQAILNLAGNALRVTAEGGSIQIKAEGCDEGVRFSIKDTGPGVAETQLPKLFEQFWQSGDTSNQLKRQGPGLGLPITKAIVEAHGGTISVESKLGSGTTFSFVLPEAKSEVDVKPKMTQIDLPGEGQKAEQA